jgi:crotonobetainyl-CoA:carnitine CoA-transferase CaiB-like acyl-CoA transferase
MNPTTVYEYSGSLWTRSGGTSPTNYPQGIMPCKDGVIAVNVMYYAEWDRLCDLLEHPEWRTDPRLATPVDRVRNRQVIDEVLLPWLERMTPDEAFRVGQAHKLPFSPVATVPDLLASEQLAARGFWVEQPDARLGEFVAPGLPFTLSGVEHAPPRPAPELGADTPDVLRDVLGSSAWELDRLRTSGVI